MNRLYVVEPTLTLTGAAADHRLAVASRDVAAVRTGHRRRAEVGDAAQSTNSRHGSPHTPAGSPRWHATWPPIGARAWSLPARRSRPEVHALAHLINHALGNVGKTVEFIARVDAGPADQIGSLRELVRDIERRRRRDPDHSGRKPRLRRPGGPRLRQRCSTATRSSCASTSGSMTMRRPSSATGISPRPIASNRGATFWPLTGPRRSSSR